MDGVRVLSRDGRVGNWVGMRGGWCRGKGVDGLGSSELRELPREDHCGVGWKRGGIGEREEGLKWKGQLTRETGQHRRVAGG